MSDRFTDLLSSYLDHDLPRGETDAVERHLAGCAECRDTIAALEVVKTRAAALVDPPAPTDLWAGIASRIGPAGSTSANRRRAAAGVRMLPERVQRWTMPQWLAAAAAFAVVALAVSWFAQDRLRPVLRGPQPGIASSDGQVAPVNFDPSRVETEIGQIQQALDRGRDKLDPKTIQVLEENLRIIRKATEDARQALERDPANRDLQDYFAGSVQSKLDLVRSALAGV